MSRPSRSQGPAPPRLLHTLRNDVRIVTKEMMRRGVHREVGGTLAGLEAFYLTREDRARLDELSAVRRFFRRNWYFLRGLLLKLTPARRIMLAVALFAIVLGAWRIDIDTVHIAFRVQGLGIALVLGVLVLELKDKLVARDELEAGRAVQLALMPTDRPNVPGWDVWLYTQPANDVGGDLVDHLPLADDQHAVLLGDVTGKALPAALLAVKLQATLRALAPHLPNLGDLASGVNGILYRDGLPTRFASLVYAVLTPNSGQVRMLIAGHMPPIHLHNGGTSTLPQGSMVIGMMPDVPFWEQAVSVDPGDTLVVYSDGVSEAMNEREDFFGEERLHPIVMRTGGLTAAEAGTLILEELSAFVGHAEQSDDVSLMVLRRVPEAT